MDEWDRLNEMCTKFLATMEEKGLNGIERCYICPLYKVGLCDEIFCEYNETENNYLKAFTLMEDAFKKLNI